MHAAAVLSKHEGRTACSSAQGYVSVLGSWAKQCAAALVTCPGGPGSAATNVQPWPVITAILGCTPDRGATSRACVSKVGEPARLGVSAPSKGLHTALHIYSEGHAAANARISSAFAMFACA